LASQTTIIPSATEPIAKAIAVDSLRGNLGFEPFIKRPPSHIRNRTLALAVIIRDSLDEPQPGWIFALLPRFDKTAWRRGWRP
jgi:hypothetical protein